MATKVVTFEFPADAWDGIQAAFAARFGVPEGKTQQQVVVDQTLDWIGEIYRTFAVNASVEEARQIAMNVAEDRVKEVKASTTITVE